MFAPLLSFNSVVITARVSHRDVSLLAAQRRLSVLRLWPGAVPGDPGAGCRDDTESWCSQGETLVRGRSKKSSQKWTLIMHRDVQYCKMSRDTKSCPELNIHDWDWVDTGDCYQRPGPSTMGRMVVSSVLCIESDQNLGHHDPSRTTKIWEILMST